MSRRHSLTRCVRPAGSLVRRCAAPLKADILPLLYENQYVNKNLRRYTPDKELEAEYQRQLEQEEAKGDGKHERACRGVPAPYGGQHNRSQYF